MVNKKIRKERRRRISSWRQEIRK